jgi:hypothetical protein
MRLILVTFGGREVSLQILFNYVKRYSKYISEYHIYIATTNEPDIAFMKAFAKENSFVKLIDTYKEGVLVRTDLGTIWDNAYTNCQEEDAVYLKLDDDIVFMEETLFTDFVEERIKDNKSPLLYPVILNNAVINAKLEEVGVLKLSKQTHLAKNWPAIYEPHADFFKSSPGVVRALQDYVGEKNLLCPVAWGDLSYVYELHSTFLRDLFTNQLHKYHIDSYTLSSCEPASIAAISWKGAMLKSYVEKYGSVKSDEQWWSVYLPTWTGERNTVCGKAVVSHYAYYRQRELGLDKTDVLQDYLLYSRG